MTSEQFKTVHLNAHNKHRAKHGCPPVQMSAEMCAYAQEWAQHLANTRAMKHRTNRKYGENIYMRGSTPAQAVEGDVAINRWYNEVRNYNYGGVSSGVTGHFTQVVWKSTTRIGVGMAWNSYGQTFVVTNYDPPGNCGGKYTANVPRPV